MKQQITILNIITILLEYPLLSLLQGNLKKAYSIELKKKIQKLKSLIKNKQDFSDFNKEFEELQIIISQFILSKQQELSEEQQVFLKNLNECLMLLKDENINSKIKIFDKISFSFVLEKLKQDPSFNGALHVSKTNAHEWEKKAYQVSQYSSDLNRELEHIAGDVTNLLKTIKTLKAKLTLEESRSEILTEEKKALTKELALEKRKQN